MKSANTHKATMAANYALANPYEGYLIYHGECISAMRTLADESIDSIGTDPPYGLGYQGKQFDDLGKGAQQREWHRLWAEEAYRVLKPGGYVLAFCGSRTYHHLAAGLEEAGFEIRDMLNWIYASGMNKHPQTGLKPAHEPIVVARKPLKGTVKDNVNTYGTGAYQVQTSMTGPSTSIAGGTGGSPAVATASTDLKLRQPSNVLFSHSPECVRTEVEVQAPANTSTTGGAALASLTVEQWECVPACPCRSFNEADAASDTNSTSQGRVRFFRNLSGAVVEPLPIEDILTGQEPPHLHCSKPSKKEHEAGLEHLPAVAYSPSKGTRVTATNSKSAYERPQVRRNVHPTIKPIELMRWLCRLVTPEGGTILDPFLGSGTTGCAVGAENNDPKHAPNWKFIGIEADFEDDGFIAIAEGRIRHWAGPDAQVEVRAHPSAPQPKS